MVIGDGIVMKFGNEDSFSCQTDKTQMVLLLFLLLIRNDY